MQDPKEETLDWVRRHANPIALAVMVLGLVLTAAITAIFAPDSVHLASSIAVVVLLVAYMAFYAWVITPLKRPETLAAGSGGLTIREHFKRTNALYMRIALPIIGAWVGGILFFGTGMTKAHQYALSIGGSIIGVLIGSLFIRNHLCCPRCGSNFKKERFAKLGRWTLDTRGTADIWDACPHCGVSFDEEYRR